MGGLVTFKLMLVVSGEVLHLDGHVINLVFSLADVSNFFQDEIRVNCSNMSAKCVLSLCDRPKMEIVNVNFLAFFSACLHVSDKSITVNLGWGSFHENVDAVLNNWSNCDAHNA